MTRTRDPAVSGTFYDARPEKLRQEVETYLADAAPCDPPPKALIVPHAGLVYSGPVAGAGYRCLEPLKDVIRRVVMLGPAHRVPIRGIAAPSADAFDTPLGSVPIDRTVVQRLEALPQVVSDDRAHAPEHSLEVHLPFLQVALPDFRIVPLLCRDVGDEEVAEVLELVWGGPETLIVVSTDLSHFLDYETAVRIDVETAEAIEAYRPDSVQDSFACGAAAVRGLLRVADRKGLAIHRLDLRNSGDTAGPRDRVVGYGAWSVTAPPDEAA